MKSPLGVPEIVLDRASLRSLRQQIYSQIALAVEHGALLDGMRLPSSRLLAKLLGVSRNTVVEAYEKLLENGFIVVRPGSGIKVSRAAQGTIPNFRNLRRTAQRAHYPVRTFAFEDPDGTSLYLNLMSGD